jgi:hypothetical protein
LEKVAIPMSMTENGASPCFESTMSSDLNDTQHYSPHCEIFQLNRRPGMLAFPHILGRPGFHSLICEPTGLQFFAKRGSRAA